MSLSIQNLSKAYPNGVTAIDNLSIEIKNGMFGLLGPNGAGKSSLMRTIATLQKPDLGTIHFNNINVLKDEFNLRKVLGYLPQEFSVYPKVSAEKLLDYFATLKGVSSRKDRQRITQYVLELTNLYDVRKKHVSGYSGGMKQRFGIAQVLLNKPELIIVDEPTAGLDPAERNRFLNVLREVGTTNTVILSTHIVDDVKELCTDMAIMGKGKILLKSSPSAATAAIEGRIWQKSIAHEKLVAVSDEFHVLSSHYNPDNTLSIRMYSEEQPDEHAIPVTPNLEDVYFITLQNLTVPQ
ncbi:ABC transporter ATP-binding protein [Spongiimicrobium salis]|uniref:ABC transporter ATP-binding protein n=1 Tax=Spongiimicrobium salis TaxID=1667022 RepID=UPI00374D6BAA